MKSLAIQILLLWSTNKFWRKRPDYDKLPILIGSNGYHAIRRNQNPACLEWFISAVSYPAV